MNLQLVHCDAFATMVLSLDYMVHIESTWKEKLHKSALINKYYQSLWYRLWILSWLCIRNLLTGLWVGKVPVALSLFLPKCFYTPRLWYYNVEKKSPILFWDYTEVQLPQSAAKRTLFIVFLFYFCRYLLRLHW